MSLQGIRSNGEHRNEIERVACIALQVISCSLEDDIWSSPLDFKVRWVHNQTEGKGAELVTHTGAFSAAQNNSTNGEWLQYPIQNSLVIWGHSRPMASNMACRLARNMVFCILTQY